MAGEFGPPLWNCTLMSRPMPADGTCKYSTGRPGRENAPAVAVSPTTPTSPGSVTAATAATAIRRGMAFAICRIFPTKLIPLPIPYLSFDGVDNPHHRPAVEVAIRPG